MTPADEPGRVILSICSSEIFKIKEMVYLNDEARAKRDYVTAHYSMVTEVSGCNYTNHRWLSRWRTAISARPQPYVMAHRILWRSS